MVYFCFDTLITRSTCIRTSLAHARPMKNNGLVKLVYQTCVADVSKCLKYFIEFTCGEIKKCCAYYNSLANVSAGCCLLPELHFLP